MLKVILEKKDKVFFATSDGILEIQLLKPGLETGRVQLAINAPRDIKVSRNIDKPGFLSESEIKSQFKVDR